MYRDLLFYYSIDLRDVVDEDMRYSPALILALCEGLPQGSATVSMMNDPEYWRHFLGVTRDTYLLISTVDAINANTRATGNFKKKPKFTPYPTPFDEVAEARKRAEAAKQGGVKGAFARIAARYGVGKGK